MSDRSNDPSTSGDMENELESTSRNAKVPEAVIDSPSVSSTSGTTHQVIPEQQINFEKQTTCDKSKHDGKTDIGIDNQETVQLGDTSVDISLHEGRPSQETLKIPFVKFREENEVDRARNEKELSSENDTTEFKDPDEDVGLKPSFSSVSMRSVSFCELRTLTYYDTKNSPFHYISCDTEAFNSPDSERNICPFKFIALFDDRSFVDYFNVFLQQPVFGQRAMYDLEDAEFVFEPPLPPDTHENSCLIQDRSFDWCRVLRYPFFLNSPLYLDYKLGLRLREQSTATYRKTFVTGSACRQETEDWRKLLDLLIGHVVGMQAFRRSMTGTDAEMIYSCWMQLERYRRFTGTETERRAQAEHIIRTYMTMASRKYIPEWRRKLGIAACLNFNIVPIDATSSRWKLDEMLGTGKAVPQTRDEQFLALQEMIFNALKSYWLPRYVLHVLSSNDDSVLRSCFHWESIVDPTFGRVRAQLMSLFQLQLETKDAVKTYLCCQNIQGSTESQPPISTLTPNAPLLADAGVAQKETIKPHHLIELWTSNRCADFCCQDSDRDDNDETSSEGAEDILSWGPPAMEPLTPSGQGSYGHFFFCTCLQKTFSDSDSPGSCGCRRHRRLIKTEAICANMERLRRLSRKCRSAPPVYPQSTYRHSLIRLCQKRIESQMSVHTANFLNTGNIDVTEYQNSYPRLVSAVASDDLAGSPFAMYLYHESSYPTYCTLLLYRALVDLRATNTNELNARGESLIRHLANGIVNRFLMKHSADITILPDNSVQMLKNDLMSLKDEFKVVPHVQDECCECWGSPTRFSMRNSNSDLFPHDLLPDPTLECHDPLHPMSRAFDFAIACTERGILQTDYSLTELQTIHGSSIGSLTPFPVSVTKTSSVMAQRSTDLLLFRRVISDKFPAKIDLSTATVSPVSLYKRKHVPDWAKPEKMKLQDVSAVVVEIEKKLGFQNIRSKVGLRRPTSLAETLRSYSQRENFAEFLKGKGVLLDLNFVLDVQKGKSIKKADKVARYCHTIHKKYFSKRAGYGTKFDCKAEILRAIPNTEFIAPAAYTRAQAAVFMNLQNKWFAAYQATFGTAKTTDEIAGVWKGRLSQPQDEDMELVASLMRKKKRKKISTGARWLLYINVITTFIRGISSSLLRKLFHLFLCNEIQNQYENVMAAPGGLTSGTANNSVYPELPVSLGGRHIILNRVPSDVQFWFEVMRYKYMERLYGQAHEESLSIFHPVDLEHLRLKAANIIRCFLHSDVNPLIRVNLSTDFVEETTSALHRKFPHKGLFHDGLMTLFPHVFHYWKRFLDTWHPLKRSRGGLIRLFRNKYAQIKQKYRNVCPHGSADFTKKGIKQKNDPDSSSINLMTFSVATGMVLTTPFHVRVAAISSTTQSAEDLMTARKIEENMEAQLYPFPSRRTGVVESNMRSTTWDKRAPEGEPRHRHSVHSEYHNPRRQLQTEKHSGVDIRSITMPEIKISADSADAKHLADSNKTDTQQPLLRSTRRVSEFRRPSVLTMTRTEYQLKEAKRRTLVRSVKRWRPAKNLLFASYRMRHGHFAGTVRSRCLSKSRISPFRTLAHGRDDGGIGHAEPHSSTSIGRSTMPTDSWRSSSVNVGEVGKCVKLPQSSKRTPAKKAYADMSEWAGTGSGATYLLGRKTVKLRQTERSRSAKVADDGYFRDWTDMMKEEEMLYDPSVRIRIRRTQTSRSLCSEESQGVMNRKRFTDESSEATIAKSTPAPVVNLVERVHNDLESSIRRRNTNSERRTDGLSKRQRKASLPTKKSTKEKSPKLIKPQKEGKNRHESTTPRAKKIDRKICGSALENYLSFPTIDRDRPDTKEMGGDPANDGKRPRKLGGKAARRRKPSCYDELELENADSRLRNVANKWVKIKDPLSKGYIVEDEKEKMVTLPAVTKDYVRTQEVERIAKEREIISSGNSSRSGSLTGSVNASRRCSQISRQSRANSFAFSEDVCSLYLSHKDSLPGVCVT